MNEDGSFDEPADTFVLLRAVRAADWWSLFDLIIDSLRLHVSIAALQGH